MKQLKNILRPLFNLFKKKYTKVLSLDGKYYYIQEFVYDYFSCGWLEEKTGVFYPFIFWKIKKGGEVKATDKEVERYFQYIKDNDTVDSRFKKY